MLPVTGCIEIAHFTEAGTNVPKRALARKTDEQQRRARGTAAHGLRDWRDDGPQISQHGIHLLHEQGWNHQVIERQLAHAERNAVSAAYNFAEHLPDGRKMMQAWADYLDALKMPGKR